LPEKVECPHIDKLTRKMIHGSMVSKLKNNPQNNTSRTNNSPLSILKEDGGAFFVGNDEPFIKT
jgi:hypothetical protein